jgi:hypothetical protein
VGVALGLRAEARGGSGGSGVAFALAGLARPEGAAIFGVFWLARLAGLWWRGGRSGGWRGLWGAARRAGLAHDALIVTGVFLVHVAFRVALYDGELLPNTVYAKIGGYDGVAPWTYVRFGSLVPLFGPLGVGLALLGLALGAVSPALAVPLVVVSSFGAAEPLWAATDWMPGWRIVVPYLPLTAAWVAVGWASLVAWLRPLARVGPVLALLTLPLLWLRAEPERRGFQEDTLLRVQGYATGHRALVRWLRTQVQPGDSVALMDIGIVGYTMPDTRVLDITGLTDRFIAKSAGSFLKKRYDPLYVLGRRPRFIVIALFAQGASYGPPEPGTGFRPWSDIERALIDHPEFRRIYARPRPPEPAARWPQDFAAAIGARIAFEHAQLGRHYILAVFEAQGA